MSPSGKRRGSRSMSARYVGYRRIMLEPIKWAFFPVCEPRFAAISDHISEMGSVASDQTRQQLRPMSASLIGRPRSRRFQTIRRHGVDVARGLALLFGLGTTALPSWDSRIRWNNLYRGLAVR